MSSVESTTLVAAVQEPSVLTATATAVNQPSPGAESATPMRTLEEIHADYTEQAGVPVDGTWHFVDAYEYRVCYHHGQVEWLLLADDRWMSPDHFRIAGAREKLEDLLARYRQSPSNRLSLSRKHAACGSRLWSQVDTATDIRQADGKTFFKIRWKLQWIPESDIDDVEWVRRSFAVKSEELGRRRSGRHEGIPKGLTANQEAMLRVIQIE
jgi:hypothetical protein